MSTQVRDWLGEAGIVTQKRVLKDRRPYLYLFPRPTGKSHIIKKNAGVTHTVKFIPMMVKATLNSTENFVDIMIAPTLKQTCANLWRWVFEHIRYTPDGENEVVRAPHRTASDGKGDCDCMTGFLDSCLENVRRKTGWMFWIVNRITKYRSANFQHIYPIVITPTGERIILDCVTDKFNYEENYSAKEDHIMDLEFLNGFDGMELNENDEFFNGIDDEDEIGKLKIFQKVKDTIKKVGAKTKEVTKKVVHTTNAVNPATLLLRQGFLTAMKTNLMNVAGRMKWAYVSEEQAKKKGFDMKKYEKLRKLRDRMEKTFYGAGGKKENLKAAILNGKGNSGKEVSGFGLIPIYAMQSEGLTTREILGNDLYERENGGEVSGLGVVAAAAVASATAAIAAIAAALKEIGAVKAGEPNTDNPDAAGSTVDPKETDPTTEDATDNSGETNADSNGDSSNADSGSSNSNAKSNEKGDEATDPKFLDDPMGWIKANPGKSAVVALGTLGLVYGVYKLTKGKSKSEEAERNQPSNSRDRGNSNGAREEFHPIAIGN
jgi:hypothetical protein